MSNKLMLTFRVTQQEKKILNTYCDLTGRTQVDVFREFVRTLENKIQKLEASNL
ncbi:hypothetical protein G7B40_032075 [Aetokthonos hydrillicola Thurmond2011]|uniref:Uncharacterized protein n=1 Tax=Aetokthonos hydrillicola Thurmond2011 TaxID=2712845 RepID=A0AAP5I636_9CYAN|nr:hypothetical protein [Aetokthonos hydrillicola]MDR9893160.1 hypothetical protein [Aetokthonos hydrillicola Thurmond2011]MDR9894859.1 hypothetical protein [Aetokthonos hydrillicola Thurmond2011]MDR9896793.1 hypothetical protein [Aetokthonos hydrillicola Thurmond2011]MDR9899165.1 hypothetical protein [Aetokthonos hydrillicola Thurmond2011]